MHRDSGRTIRRKRVAGDLRTSVFGSRGRDTLRCALGSTRGRFLLAALALLTLTGCPGVPPPPPVDTLECRAKPTKVDVAWAPLPEALGYAVHRSIDDGPLTQVSLQREFIYADQGLENDRVYRYVVYSIGMGGYSELPSNRCAAVPCERGERCELPQNSPPEIVSLPPPTAVVTMPYLYDVEAIDPDGDIPRLELVSGPEGMQIGEMSHVLMWTPSVAQVGPAEVTIAAIDPEGERDTQSFVIDVQELGQGNLPPMFTSIPPTMAMEAMLFVYDADAEDPEGEALVYSLDEAPLGMSVDANTGELDWTPTPDQVGVQSVTLRAADPLGLFATQAFDLEVAPVVAANMPPEITSTPLTSAPAGVAYVYDVAATDPEGSVLTFSLVDSPFGMTIDAGSGLIEWTPNAAQVGASDVVVRVRDPEGLEDRQSFEVNVFVETFPPVFTTTPLTVGTEASIYYYSPAAEDPDGGPVSVSAVALPAGMVLHDTGILRWVPTSAQVGPHSVRLLATDDEGDTTIQDYDILVADLLEAPVITSLPVTGAEVGDAYQYDVDAFDPEAETLVFAFAGSPPSGMTIDAASGVIDWTPASGTVGPVDVRVRATDPGGLFDEQAYAIQVIEDPVLVVSPTGEYVLNVGEELDLLVASNYADAVLSAGPTISNAVLGENDHWVFNPTAEQVGVHIVAFKARVGGKKASSLVKVTVGDLNQPPTIEPVPPQTVAEGQMLTFGIVGADPDGDALRYSSPNTLSNSVFNEFSRLFQFQPNFDQAGVYDVDFTVSDGESSAATTVRITVTESTPPPERLELVVDPPASPTLARSATISGNVVGAPGIPITDTLPPFITSLSPTRVRQGRGTDVTFSTRGLILEEGATTVSFGAGIEVTALEVLDASTARATIEVDASATVGSRLVSASSSGEARADSVIAFLVEPGAAQISGVVTDPFTEQPLAGARVLVRGTATEVLTDENGAFVLDGLPAGDVQLLVSQPNYELGYLDILVTNNQVVTLTAPVEMRALARPAAPGGTLPRAASLISVIDRGINAKGGGLDFEQAKLVVLDTILAVGGSDLGVFDEAGNQLNPRAQGEGLLSLTPLAVEAQALALIDGDLHSLGEILNDIADAFSWAGPVFDPRDIVDDLNRIAAEAWANPQSPESTLAIILFNEGTRISSAPPILTMDSRLNRFQSFLLISSFIITYGAELEVLANKQLTLQGIDPATIVASRASAGAMPGILPAPAQTIGLADALTALMVGPNAVADWLVPAASAQTVPPNQPAANQEDRLTRSLRAVWKKARTAQFSAELIIEAIIQQGVKLAAQKIMVNMAGRTAGAPGAVGALAVTQTLIKGGFSALMGKMMELWQIERAVLNYEPETIGEVRSANFEIINGARRLVITFTKSETELNGGPQGGLNPIIEPSTVLNEFDGIQPENFRYTYQLLKFPNCNVRDYADNGVRLIENASLQPVYRKDADGNPTRDVEQNLLQFVVPPEALNPGINFFRVVTFQIYSEDDIALNAARIEHKFSDVGIKVEPLTPTIYKEVVSGIQGVPGELTAELAELSLETQRIQEGVEAGTLSEVDAEFRIRAQDKRINKKLEQIKDDLVEEITQEGWIPPLADPGRQTPPDRRNIALNLMESARQMGTDPDEWLDPASPTRARASAELGADAIDEQTAAAFREMHLDLNDADNARVDMDLASTAVERLHTARSAGSDVTFQQIELDGTVSEKRYEITLSGELRDTNDPPGSFITRSFDEVIGNQEVRIQEAAQRHSLATSAARLQIGSVNRRMLDTDGALTRLRNTWNDTRLGSALAQLQEYKGKFNKWKRRYRLTVNTLDVLGPDVPEPDTRARNALDVPEYEGKNPKLDRNLRTLQNAGTALDIGGKIYSFFDFQNNVKDRAKLLISPPSACFQVEGDNSSSAGFNIETHPNYQVDGVIAPVGDPNNPRGGFLAVAYPGTDWAPTLASAGFPSNMIAVDSRGNIYANNAASNFSYGGRMFRYDQVIPGGDFQLTRQLIGAVNYYSLQLQYGRPASPVAMEISDYLDSNVVTWEDLFVADFDLLTQPGVRTPRIRRIPIHLIEEFPGGYDGPQRQRMASVAYAEHPNFQFTGPVDMEVGPPGFFAPNNPPRDLYVSDQQRVFRISQPINGANGVVDTFIDLPGRQWAGMAFDSVGNFFFVDAASGTVFVIPALDLEDPITQETELTERAYPIKVGLQQAQDIEISGDEDRYFVSTSKGIEAFFMPVVGREGPNIRSIKAKTGAREYDITRRGLGENNTFIVGITHDELINSELRLLVERRDPETNQYSWDEVTAELAAQGITIISEAL